MKHTFKCSRKGKASVIDAVNSDTKFTGNQTFVGMMGFSFFPFQSLPVLRTGKYCCWACSCRSTQLCCSHLCSAVSHFSNCKIWGALLFFSKSWQHKVQTCFLRSLKELDVEEGCQDRFRLWRASWTNWNTQIQQTALNSNGCCSTL